MLNKIKGGKENISVPLEIEQKLNISNKEPISYSKIEYKNPIQKQLNITDIPINIKSNLLFEIDLDYSKDIITSDNKNLQDAIDFIIQNNMKVESNRYRIEEKICIDFLTKDKTKFLHIRDTYTNILGFGYDSNNIKKKILNSYINILNCLNKNFLIINDNN